MVTKPISYYLAPGLLVFGALLAAVNWYLNPARPVPSARASSAWGVTPAYSGLRRP